MKPTHLARLCAALVSAFAAAASAGIYKWVDKDGHVQYGDRPPPDPARASQEVNTSGVPLALQKRLRQLDHGFTVKRITGNLDHAWACIETKAGEYEEPAFVAAFKSSELGEIKRVAAAEENEVEYDASGNAHWHGTAWCPAPSSGSEEPMAVYEMLFDPKVVKTYRGAQ